MNVIALKTLIRPLVLAVMLIAGIGTATPGPAVAAAVDSIIAAHVGEVAVALIARGDTLTAGSASPMPLMSSFKIHVGLAALDVMERRGHGLDSVIHVPASAMHRDTWSPMRDSTGVRDVDIQLGRVLYFSTCRSDNNACDILIELAGGIDSVAAYVERQGLDGFTLAETEASMHEDVLRSYGNRATALSLCRLMAAVYDDAGSMTPGVTAVMRRLLGVSTTGRDKIAAGLPADAFVGHKSGLSDRRPDGLLIASCDVAAFTLPDGSTAFLSIMVRDTPESDERLAPLFVDITSLIYASLCADR